MSDQRFFDLAMKAIAHQPTDAERAELDALLAREPGLRAEFARLQADVRLAKEVLPLVDATSPRRLSFPPTRAGGCKPGPSSPWTATIVPLVDHEEERRMMWRWPGCSVWPRRRRQSHW